MSRLEQLILKSALEGNILPLTSTCNVSCIFCSHRQNPPGLEVYRIPNRSPDEVARTLEFISGDKKIIIGESVTRIIEGEPFCHPNIIEILKLIRNKFSHVPIQITTNGTYINDETAFFLKQISPVEIILSLNSASVKRREIIMKDKRAGEAVNAPPILKKYGIPYHGSIVALPVRDLPDKKWEDVIKTIIYLDQWGAETVRVFYPGYTKFTLDNKLSHALLKELDHCIKELRPKIKTPVTVEPKKLSDLEPVIEGVIYDSPAQKAGIETGDVIIKINGEPVFSRVHAFNLIKEMAKPVVLIKRAVREGQEIKEVLINKEANTRSGLVMDYDLDPGIIEEILRTVKKERAAKVLIMTSLLAEKVIKKALEKYSFWYEDLFLNVEFRVLPVQSCFFGGSIMCAGLLVVGDFIKAWRDFISKENRCPDLILLPAISFDDKGLDLEGQSYLKIEESTGIPVKII